MPSAALIGGAIAGPVIGGLIGMQTSAANRAAAQAASQAALNDINAVGAPPDQQAAIILQKFQQAGLYQPGMENMISAGISQASQTNTNTQGRAAQVQALGQLQQRAGSGYSATDRAALNQIMQQSGAAEQGQLGSIQQALQARGAGGGGAQLAQQLSAAQQSGNQQANNALGVAATGQQAALQAAVQSGQLGGQLNASDFGQAQAKAQAADRFKLFDTQNALAVQQQNTQAANQGQLYNLSNAQQIQNANTQQANAEQARELAAQQQQWQEQMGQAQAQANAQMGYATAQTNYGNQNAGQWAGIGAGVGAGAGAGLNYYAKQGGGNTQSSDPSGTNYASASQYGSPAGTGNATNALVNNPDAMDTAATGGMVLHRGQPIGNNPMIKYASGGEVPDTSNLTSNPNICVSRPDTGWGAVICKAHGGVITNPGMACNLATGGVVNNANQLMGANLAYGGNLAPNHAALSPVQKLLVNHAGKVPGKAPVPGDSYSNDRVPAMLSAGELIIPRSVVERGPDSVYGFAHAIMKAHKENK